MVLIETLWNVNVINFLIAGDFQILVLIETLWNVNDRTALTDSFIKSVLIETLWNVNCDVFAVKSRKILY